MEGLTKSSKLLLGLACFLVQFVNVSPLKTLICPKLERFALKASLAEGFASRAANPESKNKSSRPQWQQPERHGKQGDGKVTKIYRVGLVFIYVFIIFVCFAFQQLYTKRSKTDLAGACMRWKSAGALRWHFCRRLCWWIRCLYVKMRLPSYPRTESLHDL